MNVLLIGWDSYGIADMVEAFIKAGFIVDFFDYPIIKRNMRKDPEMGEAIVRKLNEQRYEFVFSFNFFIVVSLACNACRVKYVSWTYDNPSALLYSRVLEYPYNFAFLFDRTLYNDLKSKGFETVYYLPLAVNVPRYDHYIPTADEHNRYAGDIIFVGSTYNEKKDLRLYSCIEAFEPYTQGYLEGLMQAQRKVSGHILMDGLLPEKIMKDVTRICKWGEYPDDIQTKEWYFSRHVLARKITQMDRQAVLPLLAEKHQVYMHTNDKKAELGKVIKRDPVDSWSEAVKVYKCAKINLNITLRSIETGIPLRIFDIMGSSGFLLTNYQEDMLLHFEPDVDFVYYTDHADLLRKVNYYLEHEEERQQIAKNGYEKVKQMHTYEQRLNEILEVIYE